MQYVSLVAQFGGMLINSVLIWMLWKDPKVGPAGPPGAPGPMGPTGKTGPMGLRGYDADRPSSTRNQIA